jgi:hypothetical protein
MESSDLRLLTGVVTTYVAAILKFRKDLEARYDRELHEARIRAHTEFWKRQEPLTPHAPPKPLTRQTLFDLLVSLRQWYYEEGGIYMSDKSRPACIDLKNDIWDILKDLQEDTEVSAEVRKRLQDKASCLRAHLAADMGSRKSSPVLSSWWSQFTKQHTQPIA